MNAFTVVDELPESRLGAHGDKLLFEFADFLRANPGKWGAWPKPQSVGGANTAGTKVRKGGYKAFPLFEFEATVREGKLFVRYTVGHLA